MHCRLSLSLHFQSLCSAMPSLLKEAGKLTNIQILYFKRISVQILFSIHRALHIFGLGEGTRGNSYFNRILLNYPLFRLSLAFLQTKHISVHLHNKTKCKLFEQQTIYQGRFQIYVNRKHLENSKYSYIYKKVEYLLLKIGSIVLIHC